jgi:CO dehydrogenase maturation factor
MKLFVGGEGGSGKSTLAVLIALQFQRMGRHVLLVDADAGRDGMHRLAGAPTAETLLGYVERETAAHGGEDTCPLFFEQRFAPADLPPGCGARAQGVRMLKIGAVRFPADGCACPAGGILGRFLANLNPGVEDRIVVDLAAGAGLPELPAGAYDRQDWILGVIAPTYASFRLARELLARASTVAPARVGLIINKIDAVGRSPLGSMLDPQRVLAEMPLRDELDSSAREGAPLTPSVPECEALCRRLEEACAPDREI